MLWLFLIKMGLELRVLWNQMPHLVRYLDPSHVFSDENGILRTPNFELNDLMVTLSYANLLYEANTTAFKSSRQNVSKHIGVIKVIMTEMQKNKPCN